MWVTNILGINAGDLKKLSMDQTLSEDNRNDNRQFFFHMVTHVFDSYNLPQQIFVIDTWRAAIYFLGHGLKHMLTILPTIWRPGLKPGFHIDVMVVSTVANLFLTLSQAILIQVNTLITTSQASPAL